MAFPALHSTLAPSALTPLLTESYGLLQPTLSFVRRGINDTYRVESRGQTFILRVYRSGWRNAGQVDWELDFVRHLASQGIQVSAALPRLDGKLFAVLDAVEGQRAYALFEYLPGRAVQNVPEEAALYGAYVARLHEAANRFSRPDRFKLDLEHLITGPMQQMRPLMAEFPDLAAQIEATAEQTYAQLSTLAPALSWGACHGDLHEVNARVVGQQIATFDFDCAGLGFRAYDLAVYWWSQVTHGQGPENSQPLWDAFLGAYLEHQPLTEADRAALPYFVTARSLWFMGLMAARTPEIGTEALGRGFFEFGAKFMTEWQAR